MPDESAETIVLSPHAIKILNFLRQSATNLEEGKNISQIAQALRIKNKKNIQEGISELQERLPTIIDSRERKENSSHRMRSHFSVDLDALREIKIVPKAKKVPSKKNDAALRLLLLGEPAFATKAFDHEYTLKGLALLSEVNGFFRDGLDEVIIQGGIMPHIPPFASTAYTEALKLLSYRKRKEEEPEDPSEKFLRAKLTTPQEIDFYERFVNNSERKKIASPMDAIPVIRDQLEILRGCIPSETPIRIQYGEEDRKNMGHIQNLLISQWADEKRETREDQINSIKKRYEPVAKQYTTLQAEAYILSQIQRKKIEREKGERPEAFANRISKEIPKTEAIYEAPPSDSELSDSFELPKFLRERIWKDSINNVARKIRSFGKRTSSSIFRRADEIRKKQGILNRKKMNLEQELNALTYAQSWTEKLLGTSGSSAITHFTSHYPLSGPEAELAWVKSKSMLGRVYDFDVPGTIIHVSPRKKIRLETEVIVDIRSGKKDTIEGEYTFARSAAGKTILLVHSLNTFSNTPSTQGIALGKVALAQENELVARMIQDAEEIPDYIISSHEGGGFAAMPRFKRPSSYIKGEETLDREIMYLINLPTLQSEEQLQWLRSHGFSKSPHLKRFNKGPYGSAAVILEEKVDGTTNFTIIDTNQLINAGKVATEIETYERELKKEKKIGVREKIQGIIAEKKSKFLADWRKIEATGDQHLGSPNRREEISNEQWVAAFQQYQEEHGLPNVVTLDEVLHGNLDGRHKSYVQYEGDVPQRFLKEKIGQIDQLEIPERQKYNLLREKVMKELRAHPISAIGMQAEMFKLQIAPYLEKVLAQGGIVAIASGNHMGNSTPTVSEADLLGVGISEKYKPQVHLFPGRANAYGVGQFRIPGDQVVSLAHKDSRKPDEGRGPLRVARNRMSIADILIRGDCHQAITSYGGGRLSVIHPGMQTENDYLAGSSIPPSVHGGINILYDPNRKGIYNVSFVLDNTLQEIIKRKNIL